MDALAKEENRKAVQFAQLLDGRVGVFEEPAARYKTRSKAIESAQKRLTAGQISVPEFLAIVTNKQNRNLAVDLANFDGAMEREDDEETVDATEAEDEMSKCVVCHLSQRQVLLQPCEHFVVCTACYTPFMKCPRCDSDTTSCRVFQ